MALKLYRALGIRHDGEDMKSAIPNWLLSHFAFGLLTWGSCAIDAKATPESNTVVSQLGPLEWIGGLDQSEANNGNGWLPVYEGQSAKLVNLSEPHSAMGDLSGNVFVADKNAHAIRVITPDGSIHTVAGNGTAGFNGDGPALQRQLNGPQNAYVLPDGTLYILDTNNRRIRRVGLDGNMTTLVAETAGLSRGLWVRRDGGLIYYCTNTSLKRWTPALGTNPGVTMAEGFSEAGNIDVALNGDVYFTDRGANSADPTFSRVFRIAPNATPATFNPVPVAGTGGTLDSGAAAEGSPALLTGLSGVRGVAFHPVGGYFLATHRGGDTWYVDTAGNIALIVQGNDGSVSAPNLLPRPLPISGSNVMSEVRSVSFSLNGDLLIAANDAGFILRARYKGPSPEPGNLQISQSSTSGGAFTLHFSQPEGSWFRLESTLQPEGSLWIPRITGVATGTPQQFSEPLPLPGDRLFYRLRRFRDWPN